jgi:hypothetical protein
MNMYVSLRHPATKQISSARHYIEYMVSLAVLYFSRLSHKQHYFRKKNIIEHKTCGLLFSTIIFLKYSPF